MGSHGSLTKAGKVRSQTPKMPSKNRKNLPPRVRNRREFLRMVKIEETKGKTLKRKR